MADGITIRRAAPADADFIAEAIIAAEKSGTGLLSYSAIFDLTEDEVRDVLKQVMDEEIEGQEICLSHFLIAEVNGERAAACACWVEAKEGVPSGQMKANIFYHVLGKEVWDKANEKLKAVAETNIDRSAEAAQIESVYTKEEFRGRGLTAMLIDEHLKHLRKNDPALSKAQVILLSNNTGAEKAYRKAGFEKAAERTGTSALLKEILPCNGKIMMERQIADNLSY